MSAQGGRTQHGKPQSYRSGRWSSPRTGRFFYGMRPSGEAVRRLCRAISEMTSRRWLTVPVEEIVRVINQRLVGWANYFPLGQVGPAYHAVDRHVAYRLRQWWRRKHGNRGRGTARFSYDDLYQTLGLIRLPLRPRHFPWAKA
jgi:RNA-directed DNA polymerase